VKGHGDVEVEGDIVEHANNEEEHHRVEIFPLFFS
jgi:hypothetical protein